MRYSLLILFLIFFFSAESFAVNKLKVGERYSGQISNIYQHGNHIILPPGQWTVVDSDRDGEYQWIGLENSKKHYVGAWVSLRREQGVRWVGTNTDCNKYKYESNGKILAQGKDEKSSGKSATGTFGGYAFWCVEENAYDIVFSVHILSEVSLNVYYLYANNYVDVNNSQLEIIGKKIFDAYLLAYKGNRNADLSFLNSLFQNKNNSNTTNEFSFESDFSGNTKKQNVDDTSSIESKLRELKSLLDAGLISQDQYDEKSSKILKDL